LLYGVSGRRSRKIKAGQLSPALFVRFLASKSTIEKIFEKFHFFLGIFTFVK
jgi:hypothetical protein